MSQVHLDQVKAMLIETFELEFSNEELTGETQLMEEGLGLTSVDVLEIIVQLEKSFKVKIPNEKVRKDAFQTIGSLHAFVNEFKATV
jgi:acyl carrier protein